MTVMMMTVIVALIAHAVSTVNVTVTSRIEP
jgi:hypothetical protein